MNEWISVKDRLPEDNINVIICFQKRSFDFCSLGTTKDGERYWHGLESIEVLITHWMSLPEPPGDTP